MLVLISGLKHSQGHNLVKCSPRISNLDIFEKSEVSKVEKLLKNKVTKVFWDTLYQVGVSVHWNIIQYSDSFIPSLVELVKLGTVEIIQAGGVEVACVDVV